MPTQLYSLNYLYQQRWFNSLSEEQRELLQQSFYLLEEVSQTERMFFDYSFVVMPAAKAYEGFIKDLVYKLGLITEKRYRGMRFRVGKALNPELARTDPDAFETLYDDLQRCCQGPMVAAQLWETWKDCRNEVFHYFVGVQPHITLGEARQKVQQILHAMEQALTLCTVSKLSKHKA